jgi:hypothetical protein
MSERRPPAICPPVDDEETRTAMRSAGLMLASLGEDYDEVLSKIRSARSHPDPEVQRAWELVAETLYSPSDIRALAAGLRDPRQRRGRPKGSSRYRPQAERNARELDRRVAGGESSQQVRQEMLDRPLGHAEEVAGSRGNPRDPNASASAETKRWQRVLKAGERLGLRTS